jgi:hypothetical protein
MRAAHHPSANRMERYPGPSPISIDPVSCPKFLADDADPGAWTKDEAMALVDARIEYRARREREYIFGEGRFADPVWDILLDLFIARSEGRKVSVSSACIAAMVPPTTALRHIANMADDGLVERTRHPKDNRCSYLSLSDTAYSKMLLYFSSPKSGRGGIEL